MAHQASSGSRVVNGRRYSRDRGALEARGIPAAGGRLRGEAVGEIELDGKVLVVKRIHVTYHLVVDQAVIGDEAFVGGIDLCHGRGDDRRHLGDPQAVPMDRRRYGSRPPWHDVQLELRGPAVTDVATTFRERWEDPTPLDHRNPVGPA